MENKGKVLRFSAAERDNIRKQVVGKPTGVIFSVGGFDLDLVPLTVSQAKDIFRIVDSVQGALAAATAGEGGTTNFDAANVAKLIAEDGPRAADLLRNILFQSARAAGLVDDSKAETEVFDEWFDDLPVRQTLVEFFPKLLESQGLSSMLGNSSTPPQAPTTTEPTGTSTP